MLNSDIFSTSPESVECQWICFLSHFIIWNKPSLAWGPAFSVTLLNLQRISYTHVLTFIIILLNYWTLSKLIYERKLWEKMWWMRIKNHTVVSFLSSNSTCPHTCPRVWVVSLLFICKVSPSFCFSAECKKVFVCMWSLMFWDSCLIFRVCF